MKKIVFILLFIFTFLIGCDQARTLSPTTTVELVDVILNDSENDLYQQFSQVGIGDSIELPFYSEDNYIFVGWTDGEEVYYPNYLVSGNATLTPVMELASNVFEYSTLNINDDLILKGYSGVAKYLRIPSHIDDKVITVIGHQAFVNNDLVKVEIPNSITKINSRAFADCPDLLEVVFYGDFFGIVEKTIAKDTFFEIIRENSDICQIDNTTSNKSWSYAKGCPISEVLDVTDPVIIGGVEYYSYNVVFDLEYHYADYLSVDIAHDAFYKLESLETISFSNRYSSFSSIIFEETRNLKNIIFSDDNPYYRVVDDIIYSSDMTQLVFYPNYLTDKTWRVPESVTVVNHFAFSENDYLETLIIGENVINISEYSFGKLSSLKEFIVDENNQYLIAIDGVLYSQQETNLFLLKYPANRRGSIYVLPDNVTRVLAEAFAYNKNLENIILPEGLEYINSGAFSWSQKIEFITIPSTVLNIGQRAFYMSEVRTLILKRDKIEHGSITLISMGYEMRSMTIYVPDNSHYEYLVSNDFYIGLVNILPFSLFFGY